MELVILPGSRRSPNLMEPPILPGNSRSSNPHGYVNKYNPPVMNRWITDRTDWADISRKYKEDGVLIVTRIDSNVAQWCEIIQRHRLYRRYGRWYEIRFQHWLTSERRAYVICSPTRSRLYARVKADRHYEQFIRESNDPHSNNDSRRSVS